jgi:hypothetical protein
MALLVYNPITEEEIWGFNKTDPIQYFGYLNTGIYPIYPSGHF